MQLYQLTLHLIPANTTFERIQRTESAYYCVLSVKSLCYMILKFNCSYEIKAQTVYRTVLYQMTYILFLLLNVFELLK